MLSFLLFSFPSIHLFPFPSLPLIFAKHSKFDLIMKLYKSVTYFEVFVNSSILLLAIYVLFKLPLFVNLPPIKTMSVFWELPLLITSLFVCVSTF